MQPLHWAGPNPICQWSSKDLLGPLLHERQSCCAFHGLNYTTYTANGVTTLGNLGWVQTWGHLQLLPKEWGPDGLHQSGDVWVPSRLPFHWWVCWWFLRISGLCRVHWGHKHCAEIPTWVEPNHPELHCLSHIWLTFQWCLQGLVWCCDEHCIVNSAEVLVNLAIHSNYHCYWRWGPLQPSCRSY